MAVKREKFAISYYNLPFPLTIHFIYYIIYIIKVVFRKTGWVGGGGGGREEKEAVITEDLRE